MLAIILFVVILGLLIVVHEFGHFIAARLCGIRVDEFGIGYPPRALKMFRAWGADFTLNWIPFGGFVKIFGENPLDPELVGPEADAARAAGKGADLSRSFMSKPRHYQAFVLVAGVLFNFLFAWLLISLGFAIGLPTSVDAGLGEVTNPRLVLTNIVPASPAEKAGLKPGDTVTAMRVPSGDALATGAITPENISNFVAKHGDSKITVEYTRGDANAPITTELTPAAGLIAERKAIGVGMDLIGTLRLPVHKALWQGMKTTLNLTWGTVAGLGTFIGDAFRGKADVAQVAGPIGIIGLVGDASKLGFIYILSFTAFISINLAVINLVPIPALDGGRLLFVAIEAVSRRAINAKFVYWTNAVSFVLLICLMVLVTVNDVVKLW